MITIPDSKLENLPPVQGQGNWAYVDTEYVENSLLPLLLLLGCVLREDDKGNVVIDYEPNKTEYLMFYRKYAHTNPQFANEHMHEWQINFYTLGFLNEREFGGDK